MVATTVGPQDARTADAAPFAGAAVPDHVLECRRRMLAWPNPVEFVNNMYGCHPGDANTEYFREVFAR